MDADELRRRAAAIRWYHQIDLGHGMRTPGIDRTVERLDRIRLPADLAGKSVLDVGAWDGYFSFEAERRGAGRVVACDYYAWHGLGWGTGNGKAGFDLAREALSSRVEDVSIDIPDLSPARIGKFDIVLLLGVLYHVQNPLLVLERVASVTTGMLVLETVVDMIGLRRPAVAFYPHSELNGDPTNWWGPNPQAVTGMLEAVGFKRVEQISPLRPTVFRAARAVAHAVRGVNSLRCAFRQDRAVFHAYK